MQISETKVRAFEAAMDSMRRVRMAAKDHWLHAVGLTEPQIHVLMCLHEPSAHTASAVAKNLCVSASAATQTVDTLVKHGWVERQANPSDRRITRLGLTPAGQEQVGKLIVQRHQFMKRILETLSEAEADLIIQAMTRLARAMDTAPISTQNQITERN